MGPALSSRNFAAVFVLIGSAFLAGCQSAGTGAQTAEPPPDAVRESELRAYCPPATVREGTQAFRIYEGNAEGDPNRIVYQASIDQTTRACTYGEGTGSI